MINDQSFRDTIILPVLNALNLPSPEGTELMIGTCALESKGGTFLINGDRTRFGVFGMTLDQHDEVWTYLNRDVPALRNRLVRHCHVPDRPEPERLAVNLAYACSVARVLYTKCRQPIPETLEGQALFYVEHWRGEKKNPQLVSDYIWAYKLWTD